MTGLEAPTIIGLVTGTINIVSALKTTYDAANNTQGLPQAFNEVAERLPLVRDTLQVTEDRLRALSPDEPTSSAIRTTVKEAHEKARKLEIIFQKCLPHEDASRLSRYVAALRILGKGNKVEVLMRGLLENVQDLANNQAIRAATAEQVSALARAVEAVGALEPSVSDDLIDLPSNAVRNHHSGSGDIYSAAGMAEVFNAKDNARQYRATTMNFGGQE
ncbi:hypothetical protein ONZ43_g1342 [Nemania bipapillata]|uniref:Uncharacterized protein n=1 Tax=Nemania bipapillata TaxID=110536 RepID=A0ACC2J519_9PEZI|nr:hypothetical protein ONZ43_g1342 [Nemania bipapillata]